MTDYKLAIGIVGCGGMGGGHAVAIGTGSGNAVWHIRSKDNVKLAAGDTDISKKLVLAGTYDVLETRQQWARDQGFNTYDSFEAMLADPKVDIILVATPNDSHKELSIAAMRAGKHVLCEKPVMMCSKDLEDVMAVAKETGKVFYPRQNRRWDRDFLMVKKIYDEKQVGDVFRIETRVHGSRGIPGDWRGIKKHGGGMMFDWGVHLLDRLLMCVPEKVTSVYAKFNHITNDEVDDGFTMHLIFESGLTALIESGTCNFINLPLWYVLGKDGTAVIHNWACDGKIVRLENWDDKDATPILAGEGLTKTMAPRVGGNSTTELSLPEFEYDHNELYSNLVDVIRGEAEQIVTCEQALRCLRLMEAGFESDRTNSVVSFE